MDKNLLHNFYIKNKQAKKVLFYPKKAQIHYLQHRTGRDYVLKARQLGITTLEQLRKLKRALLEPNVTVVTIAHERTKTNDIFGITRYAWDNLPEAFKDLYEVKYDNVRELHFGATGSRYYVDLDTRSGTVNDLHISELSKIKDLDDLFAGSLETVPKEGTITLETTANGLNQSHELWLESIAGKNEFTPHFYNWTWDEEYHALPPVSNKWREEYKVLAKKYGLIPNIQEDFALSDAQFYWYFLKARRNKEKVKQEYPTVYQEAFLSSSASVFDLSDVTTMKPPEVVEVWKGVQIYKKEEEDHRYIIGCDTSEGVGNDGTAIEIIDITDVKDIVNVASYNDTTIRPDQTADKLIALGKRYNNAFVIPERNSSGLTTVLRLQEKGYKSLFVNRTIDKKTKKSKREYGWRTTSTNRDVMIDDFIEAYEDEVLSIASMYAIQQMKTFVRKPNGKREHDDGYHDDNLFALFLAIQGIKYYRDNKYQFMDRVALGV